MADSRRSSEDSFFNVVNKISMGALGNVDLPPIMSPIFERSCINEELQGIQTILGQIAENDLSLSGFNGKSTKILQFYFDLG